MKRHIRLSDTEKKELLILKKNEKNVKIYKRLLFIEMKNENKKNTEILKFLGISIDTCTDWTTMYFEEWLIGLCKHKYDWRRPSKLDAVRASIEEYVSKNIIPTLPLLQLWIEQTHQIHVQVSWLSEYCKKNWICLTKRPNLSHESIKLKKFSKKP